MSEWIDFNRTWNVLVTYPKRYVELNLDELALKEFGWTSAELNNQLNKLVAELPELIYSFNESSLKNNHAEIWAEYQEILQKRRKYDAWYYNRNEVLKHFDDYDTKRKEFEKKNNDSFCFLGLARPGTLIEYVNNEGTKVQRLIGDLNVSGGMCNCGSDLSDDTIVLRYKIVWAEKND